MTALEIESEVHRDALLGAAAEALVLFFGARQKRLAALFARATNALADARDPARAPDSLVEAERAVRDAVLALRGHAPADATAVIARLEAVAESLCGARDRFLERVASGAWPESPAPPAPPALAVSDGVATLRRLPHRPRPVVQAPRLAAFADAGAISRAITEIRRASDRVAADIPRAGVGAFGHLEAVIAPVRGGSDLVSLRSPPVTEETRGPRGERAMLQRIARGLFEEVAVAGQLRMRRPGEVSPPQVARFEERLLTALDAIFAIALSGPMTIDLVETLDAWATDGPTADPFRAFSRSVILGCVDDEVTAETAVTGLRAAAPDARAFIASGLLLAPRPHVDGALARALVDADASALPHLVAVAGARRSAPAVRIGPLVRHHDPAVRKAVAIALGAAEPASLARAALERLVRHDGAEDEVTAEALASLAFFDRRAARLELRQRLDEDAARPGQIARAARVRMVEVLATIGDPSDLDRIAAALRHPESAAVVGAFGHVALVPVLLELLESSQAGQRLGADASLRRITGHRSGDRLDDREPMAPGARRDHWTRWWNEHQPRFDASRRYRFGQPVSIDALVDILVREPLTVAERAASIDELSLATGRRLPDPRDWLARVNDAVAATRGVSGELTDSGWLR